MMSISDQVNQLLTQPEAGLQAAYFKQLTAGRGLEVRDAGDGRGKGVFACQNFCQSEVVFTDPPLAAIQHSTNRPMAWVCGQCYRFLGSIEQQLGRLLLAVQLADTSEDGSSDDSDSPVAGSEIDHAVLEALIHGQLKLPCTDAVQLPAPVRCHGGCSEEWYCSDNCEQAAWEQHHRLLCIGPAEQGAEAAAAGSSNKAKGKHAAEAPEAAAETRRLAAAMLQFNDHADATNDVFRLAGKVVAITMLRAERLLQEDAAPSSSSSSSSSSAGCFDRAVSAEQAWSALLRAWLPFGVGHKGLWWECTAAEEEVHVEMHELAQDSLSLLAAALPPVLTRRYPALLSLEVWGSIIGMFEMNNLSLYVASPLHQWVEHLDALPQPHRAAVLQEAEPFLDALLENVPGCEGNAFYALHSCLNHSCDPAVHAFKREQDHDGSAVILALRDVQPGEEVTISYIDEDAPLEERLHELADYGFACSCSKCAAEAGATQ